MINEGVCEHGFGIISNGKTALGMLDYAIARRKGWMAMLMAYTKTDFSSPREYRKRYFDIKSNELLSIDEVNVRIKAMVSKIFDNLITAYQII